jgi:hypothetical protein
MAKPLSFRWDEDFVARIDEIRGDVPRSTWVQRAVELRIHLRNLTNAEIERLLSDWRGASEMREMDGSFDDVDRGIAIKAPAPKQPKKGLRRGS